MNKRYAAYLAALSATAVIAIPLASAETMNFSDLDTSNAHYPAIKQLVDRGVLNGFPDGTFKPSQSLTRGQAAVILAKALNLETSNYTKQVFNDVPSSSPYFKQINALYANNIIGGFDDQSFRPGDSLTRAQMAIILVKAYNLRLPEAVTLPFRDVSMTSGYQHYIQAIYNAGITKGTTANTFSPNAPVLRGQMASFVVRAEAYEPGQTPKQVKTEYSSSFEMEVVEYTNSQRKKYGLSPLKVHEEVMNSAQIKSDDMSKNNYFEHKSPTYGSPFDLMNSLGISYQAAGENIAMGQTTPKEVVQAWMDSEGHRANILNPAYTHIGVGYAAEGNYWTQHFIRP
ncbi:hypothetical protein D1B33_04105 [Lysinibacillus yapensis]|uniref:SLH domain-containing protein n=1 Tax=Ureibacillus yapensis TaxID=2304605 RepID=A0A396SEF8_9BACL|nr:S-layer homology domain-containing protein [Lysinibacillus yapensis]RHW40040.1 hypothetical protein D1B33_04105 [Lysinibacillus yapensis]